MCRDGYDGHQHCPQLQCPLDLLKCTELLVSSLDGPNAFRVFLSDFHFSFSASSRRVLTASFNWSHCACLQVLLVLHRMKKEITRLIRTVYKIRSLKNLPEWVGGGEQGRKLGRREGELRKCKLRGINFISSKFLLALLPGLQLGSSQLSLLDL